MKQARTILTWAVAAAIGAGTALWVQAAPVFTEQINLPDEVISLARIKRLRIDVKDMPNHPATRGVKKTEVHARCVRMLKKAGLEVTDDPTDPVLTIGLSIYDDGEGTDTLALVVIIGVYQPVRLGRLDLDRELVVPTISLLDGRVARPKEVERVIYDELTKHVTQLTWFIGKATKAMKE